MDFSLDARDVSTAGASHRVVEVTGEVDVYVAATLGSFLLEQLTELHADGGAADGQAAPSALVIDLTEMTFIDSSGLGVLVGAHKRARSLGFGLRLVTTSRQVRDLLQMTGLARLLRTFPTVTDACAA